LERKKKLVKVRRQTNFMKELVELEPLLPLR
jgi:hypothetical protein